MPAHVWLHCILRRNVLFIMSFYSFKNKTEKPNHTDTKPKQNLNPESLISQYKYVHVINNSELDSDWIGPYEVYQIEWNNQFFGSGQLNSDNLCPIMLYLYIFNPCGSIISCSVGIKEMSS